MIPEKQPSNVLPFRGPVHPENEVISGPPKPSTATLDSETASESVKAIKSILAEVDPNKFYYRSSDKNGHSQPVHARIPKHWDGAIAYIIETVKAYKCKSDFVRDAVVHRIAYLAKHHEEIDPHELAIITTEIIADKSITDGIAYDKAKFAIGKSIAATIKRKDWKAGIVLINNFAANAQGMDELYRKRITRVLDKYRKRISEARDREDGLIL